MRGRWRLKHTVEQLRARYLLRRALQAIARFPDVPARERQALPYPLILSLTSHPARFATLALTLKSLFDQTVQPDRTILWIAAADLAALPGDVTALKRCGLEIRSCEDLRSYSKLIPALRAFPEAYHVTADDDLYYPPSWLRRLVDSVDPQMPEILAHRAHLAHLDADGRLAPYAAWDHETPHHEDAGPRQLLFPTGAGGVLYPPGAFPAQVFDTDAFLSLCPRADDLWFFWMAQQHGTPHRRVPGAFPLVPWPGSQAAGLLHWNVGGNGNDMQIRALEARYGFLSG